MLQTFMEDLQNQNLISQSGQMNTGNFSFQNFELHCHQLYAEFERRVWMDMGNESLEQFNKSQHELQQVKNEVMQIHSNILDERKKQRQVVRDMRTYLTTNMGE